MSITCTNATDFIDTEFLLYSKEEFNEQHTSNELTNIEDSPMIFVKDHDNYFFAPFDKSTTQLEKVSLIPANSSVAHLISELTSSSIVLVQNTKEVIGYVSIKRFIDKMYYSYQSLNAYFEAVINTIDASVTVIDHQGIVHVWTEGAEKIFSLSKEQILGNPITDFFDIDKLEIMKTLKEGRSLYRHQHKPRSDLFVLINSNPIHLENDIVGAVVTEMDITSQVRLNQELFNMSTKVQHLEQEVAKLNRLKDPFDTIKGNSSAIKKTIQLSKKICTTNTTVLILGESGVGKELFAKAIHDTREPHDAPFIPINCGAIPSSLFESELFGYAKGAFSGADQKGKKGKIELAIGGTLFLDEIGEMPLDMQVKLLRVLQERKFYPIGGTRQINADINIIAATNRDLDSLVKQGDFRQDLFYRLNVVSINVPPLRKRQEDIVELTHYFLYEFSIRYNRPIHGISQTVMEQLLQYDWPGNIRELRNVVERLVVFSSEGNINHEDLPFTIDPIKTSESTSFALSSSEILSHEIGTLSDELHAHEKKVILHALKLHNGNKLACAKRLGITRATLYNRMKKLNIHL
ncbi:sigma-54 interaction domain-containing protein [Cytobacillus sp. Hm23]